MLWQGGAFLFSNYCWILENIQVDTQTHTDTFLVLRQQGIMGVMRGGSLAEHLLNYPTTDCTNVLCLCTMFGSNHLNFYCLGCSCWQMRQPWPCRDLSKLVHYHNARWGHPRPSVRETESLDEIMFEVCKKYDDTPDRQWPGDTIHWWLAIINIMKLVHHQSPYTRTHGGCGKWKQFPEVDPELCSDPCLPVLDWWSTVMNRRSGTANLCCSGSDLVCRVETCQRFTSNLFICYDEGWGGELIDRGGSNIIYIFYLSLSTCLTCPYEH